MMMLPDGEEVWAVLTSVTDGQTNSTCRALGCVWWISYTWWLPTVRTVVTWAAWVGRTTPATDKLVTLGCARRSERSSLVEYKTWTPLYTDDTTATFLLSMPRYSISTVVVTRCSSSSLVVLELLLKTPRFRRDVYASLHDLLCFVVCVCLLQYMSLFM